MITKKISILLLFIILSLIFSSQLVLAAECPDGTPVDDASDCPSTPGLQNPLGDIKDPRVIIGFIIKTLLGIVGSLALAVFILGGFTWVIAAGNEEKVKKGKDMVVWAALGLAVIFMSYVLVNFVIDTLTGGG